MALLASEVDAPTPAGYLLRVLCPCGITFERWITPEQAAEDVAMLARLN
jgi:hypothetical protein